MKKFLTAIFVPLLFLTQNNIAQDNYSISAGAGYILLNMSKTKLSYWENGYTFNIASDYQLTKKTALYFSTSYQEHIFQEDLVPRLDPTIYGFNYKIRGENSKTYELSAGGKIYTSSEVVKTYLGLGIGLLFINQGKVEILEPNAKSQSNVLSQYSNSGNSYTLFQFNTIAGAEFNIAKNVELVIEGKLIFAPQGPLYFPLAAMVKLNL